MQIPKLTFIYAFPLDRNQRALFESTGEPYPSISEVRSIVSERQKTWDEENEKLNILEYLCNATKRVPERSLECFVYGAGLNTMSTPFLFPAWNKFGGVHTGEKFIDLVIHELLHIFIITNNANYWEQVTRIYAEEDVTCRNHILLYALMYDTYQKLYGREPIDFSRDNLPPGYARAIEIVKDKGYREIISEYYSSL